MAYRDDNYPLNLNPGLYFSRREGNRTVKPWPSMIGHIQTTVFPLLDAKLQVPVRPLQWGASTAAINSGAPGMSFTPVTFPAMPKVRG